MASEATYSCADMFSQEDLSLLAKSLKDEKFRALFSEYAKEVCEPENQKQFERELKQLEKERGVEAVFVHPSPGFALAVGGQKSGPVFVNICSSDVVQKPSFTRVDDGVNKGENWSLPHALPKPRRELLSKKVRLLRGDDSKAVNDVGRQAVVHDIVFHPDALQLASGSHLMKHILVQTAMDSLCKNFQIKAEQPEEIETSVKYIGKPMQSVIKRVVDKKLFEASEQMSFHQDERTKVLENEIKNKNEESTNSVMKEEMAGPLKPQYKVKHVSKMDLQDFSVQLIPQCGPAWRPHTLEVEVELPGVTRASQVDANVWPQSIILSTDSTPQYKLELPLPYPVDEDLSAAKFDVSTQKLTLTLSVIPTNKKNQGTVHDHSPSSDSGIECEPDYRTNSDGDNSSEVSLSSQEESLKEIDATEEEEDNVFEPTPSKSRVTLIPSYTVKQTKESLCVVLNCGNVLPSSVVAKLVNDHSVRVELSSVGGGHTMLHYGLTVVCSPLQIAKSGVTSKVQDSIVEVTIKKAVFGQWETCQIGDGDRLTTVVLTSSSALDTEGKSSKKSMKSSKEPKCESLIKLEEAAKKQDEGVGLPRTPRMSRTVSMCETGTGQTLRLRGPTCSWPRGILKRRTRSLSESHIGSVSSMSPLGSLSSSTDLKVLENKQKEQEEEEWEESMSSSLGEKKSVRFNEVVSRQLFRTNSSILGQRAKNQRKAMRKRKCQQRHASDSDRGSDRDVHSSGDLNSAAISTDDDTDATTTDTTEVDDLDDISLTSDILDVKNNNMINNSSNSIRSNCSDIIQSTEDQNEKENINNNNKISDPSSNTSDGFHNEDDSNAGFIVKTNKKKKRKSKKKNAFEPSNNFIFQLDMDN